MEQQLEIIKKTISDLLALMGFDSQVEVSVNSENTLTADIQLNDAGFLIGQSGANLDALQYLIRLFINKQNKENSIFLTLDINHYRKNKIELLKELAQNSAKLVIDKNKPIELHPMSSFERRIIHECLADFSQISTESIGEGLERHIVIKLKP